MPTSAAPVVAARSVPAGRGWQWIVDSWTLTAGYRLLFVGLVVAFMALAVGASVLPFIGSLAIGLFTPTLQAGLILGCDALRRGQPLKIDHLFAGFERNMGRLVMLGGVSVLAGIVMLLIGGAIVGADLIGPLMSGIPPTPEQLPEILLRLMLAALVIVALSVPLYMAMWFAVPLIALRGMAVGAAMSASFTACLKNVLAFLVWSLAIMALAIVPFVPFGIAVALHLSIALVLLSTLPLMAGCLVIAASFFTSMYTSYVDVFAAENETLSAAR